MQTISTKYLPATAHKPSRIVATSSSGVRLIQSIDGEYGVESNHALVAKALKHKLCWPGKMIGGDTKTGGKVFVFENGEMIE